jgi:NADP-dependent 3-hydroxy acid dehydrogenase YdfG
LETLKEVADQIKKEISKTTEVLPIKFDVANPEEVRSFMDNLPEGWKNIDVLVNNAGLVKGVDKVGDILEEDITTMVTTNVLGLIGVCTELHRVCPSLSELRRVEPRIMRLGNQSLKREIVDPEGCQALPGPRRTRRHH